MPKSSCGDETLSTMKLYWYHSHTVVRFILNPFATQPLTEGSPGCANIMIPYLQYMDSPHKDKSWKDRLCFETGPSAKSLYAHQAHPDLRPHRQPDRLEKSLNYVWHIEADTKLSPFHRQYIQMSFLEYNAWILFKISPKFVPKVRIDNIPTLVQIMAWCRPGDKPLFEPMVVALLMNICIPLPQ